VGRKYIDHSWDFRQEDTKYSVHGFHPYPAMMIPQIARRLILEYSRLGDYILDPFCGSGTVLVESKLNNRYSVGIDINPLALLLAKVKTTPIKPKTLLVSAQKLFDFIHSNRSQIDPPTFFNIEYWFKPRVISDLARIKTAISEINDQDIKDFFLVSFSLTVRAVSNTRNSEFKLYRIEPTKLASHNPDTVKTFQEIVLRNIEKMRYFYENADRDVEAKIYLADTRKRTPLPDNHFHLLVTSPPYGDSRTTVAYGQFSRLSLQWIDLPNAKNLDRQSLGGIPTKNLENSLPKTLNKVIEKIAKQEEKRAREVLSFYLDLRETLLETTRVTSKKGIVCFVVGNRAVKGVRIPTDEILVELFKALGYNHLETIIRNIPSKTMPLQNSPTNITGRVQDTIHKENIVIVQKR